MKLYEIAHSRTGDKGNISTISLIPYKDEDYELLVERVTSRKVKAWFKDFGVTEVERFELPTLPALNFVLHNMLGGGVTRSLAIDQHGKTLSSALLGMEI